MEVQVILDGDVITIPAETLGTLAYNAGFGPRAQTLIDLVLVVGTANVTSIINSKITTNGFLLSGSLTTDDGIGDSIGQTGENIVSGTSYTATNGTYTNLQTFSAGGGTGMTVNVTVAGSTVTVMQIVNGGSGYSVGDFIGVKEATLLAAGSSITNGTLTSRALTASDLTGGGTPYMLNFNPSPVKPVVTLQSAVVSDPTVPLAQQLLIGGPQLALYHAYNSTVSSSLTQFNTDLPDNNVGPTTRLWTTSGSNPAIQDNYYSWTPDGSDCESYQDNSEPFLIETGDIIRVEGVLTQRNPLTAVTSSFNVIEDFTVEEVQDYYYSSSYDDNNQNSNQLITPINIQPNTIGYVAAGFINPQTVTAGDTFLISVSSGTIFVGSTMTGTGIPAGAKVTGGNLTTEVTLDKDIVVAGSVALAGSISGFSSAVSAFNTNTAVNPFFTNLQSSQRTFIVYAGITSGIILSGQITEEGAKGGAGGGTSDAFKITIVTCDATQPCSAQGIDSMTIEPQNSYGWGVGDTITIKQPIFATTGNWNTTPIPSTTQAMVITITPEMINQSTVKEFNNFTVSVDVGGTAESGSVSGYNTYPKGGVGFTAPTFLRVTPDPVTTLNGIPGGAITKFTVRRQLEADDKVMIKNITPPSGSKGVETPSGQGFLIPNDFSETQKSNALNIINQLKAKNAFNKPLEPGITDGGNSIIVQGSGSDTIINIP